MSKSLVPKFSIIVPAYNSSKTLKECLLSIRKSNFKDYELIVVNDGSSDETRKLASKFADSVIDHQRNFGRNRARISGFNNANGEILINIDSDVLIQEETLDKINERFKNQESLDGLTAPISKNYISSNIYSNYKNLSLAYLYSRLPESAFFIYGGIFAFRSELKNLMNSECFFADDTAIAFNLHTKGYKVELLKNVRAIHIKEYQFSQILKDNILMAKDWVKIFADLNFFKSIKIDKQLVFRHASGHVLKPIGFYVFITKTLGFLHCIPFFVFSLLEFFVLSTALFLNLLFVIIKVSRSLFYTQLRKCLLVFNKLFYFL